MYDLHQTKEDDEAGRLVMDLRSPTMSKIKKLLGLEKHHRESLVAIHKREMLKSLIILSNDIKILHISSDRFIVSCLIIRSIA